MSDTEIQFASNELGEPTWRQIESESETAYLLKSETMKRRLLEAKEREQGLSFEASVEKLGI